MDYKIDSTIVTKIKGGLLNGESILEFYKIRKNIVLFIRASVCRVFKTKLNSNKRQRLFSKQIGIQEIYFEV